MLLVESCAGCGNPGPTPCPICVRRLLRARVVPADLRAFDACRALVLYEGPARALVAGLKYRNHRQVLTWLAENMSQLLAPPPGTVVTWVPTTPARRRDRGFDQAALLARAVARRWHVPCRPLLARRPGLPQTGRSLEQRERGVPLAVARGRQVATPVVVVDDVVTTGATLRSAAAALRQAGTPWIAALTAAATPRRRLLR